MLCAWRSAPSSHVLRTFGSDGFDIAQGFRARNRFANVLALVSGVPYLALAVAVDLLLALAIVSWGRRHGRDWRETLYEGQGVVYGPYRQVLFWIGFLRRTPFAAEYPKDVEVVRKAVDFSALKP